MEQAMLVETLPATFEMETDSIMQQCASRPPEKVVIMPPSAAAPKPSAANKKPSRASLLSIISGDRKSPRTSTTSGDEDMKSPRLSASKSVGIQSPVTSATQTTVTPSAVTASPSKPLTAALEPTVTSKPATAPTFPEPAAAPTSPEPAAAPTFPELAAVPTSPELAAAPTSPEPAAAPASLEPAAAPASPEPAAAPTSPKPAPPATFPKPAAPVTSPKTCASDTVMLPAVEPKGSKELETAAKPAKKKPPPTLAKTFKSRSSSSTKSVRTPSASELRDPKLLSPKQETDDDVFCAENLQKTTPAAEQMRDVDVALAKQTAENNNTLVDKPASHLTLQVKSEVEHEGKGSPEYAAVVGNVDIMALTHSIEEPSKSLPGDIELPPPLQDERNPDLDECDNMEFPPPPDMDFLTNNEMPASIQLTTNETDATVDEAVGRISSGCDVSNIAMSNIQQDNSRATKGTTLGECKQTATAVEDINCESTDTPSHESSFTSSESVKLVSGEVEDVKVSTKMEDIIVGQMQPQGDGTDIAQEKTTTSIALEENGEQMTDSSRMDSSDDTESLTALSEDQDSAIEVNLPQLPAASSFSTPATVEPAEDSESKSSMTKGANEDGTSPLAQHLEESSGGSTNASPTPHSPPFNTSSESGDSGVGSGIYNFGGETVTVKLRPTINDNRKPNTSVPMFERNSTELKRVTFREMNSPINPTVIGLRKTPAEEERIKKTGLSDDDISQAELFYKGHKTEVMVCPCLATLYFADSNSGENIPVEDWKPEHIGIPVLIYDTGNGKRPRGLTMAFAEKGTGFLLWKTVINYQSRWEVVEPIFHRLRVITTADKYAGIAFQDESSAKIFYEYFKTCTADPEKNVLNNPNLQNKKKSRKDKKSMKHKVGPLPNKSAISKPCEFMHVTQLKQSGDGIMALAMVPDNDEGGTKVPSPQ